MIRNDEEVKVERSGNFEEATFGIDDEDVSLILEIVRNRLYRNKMGSFVREIISNAYDAMVDAGTLDAHKIHITFPCYNNKNTITIRDFGTGIDPEKIMSLYTRVGKSTRSKSDKFVGMMGIGRLVGFSLTDSFNIINYFNGVKTEYLCYIDETKRGKVAVLSRAETNEHNGLAVKVNIESSQQREFYRELAQFIAYITEVKFHFTNPDDSEWEYYKPKADDYEVSFTGSSWVKYKEDPMGRRGYVKMGIVTYPIDNRYLEGYFWNEGAVVFTVPIGSVNISASREELEYTTKTIQEISKLSKIAKKDVIEHLESSIAKAPNMKEAIILFRDCYWLYRMFSKSKLMYKDPEYDIEHDLSTLSGKTYTGREYAFEVNAKGEPVLNAEGQRIYPDIRDRNQVFEFAEFNLKYGTIKRERGSNQFSVDRYDKDCYYRIVEPEALNNPPDLKRCRTIQARQLEGAANANGRYRDSVIYNITRRGLDHFVDLNGWDPTIFWSKFDELPETAAKRLPKGESKPIEIQKLVYDVDPKGKDQYVEISSECLTVDVTALEPGVWVSRYYSQILYHRTKNMSIDMLKLRGLVSCLAYHLKRKINLYIMPSTIGRMLDGEWEKGEKDYDDLVPLHDWVENVLATTDILNTFNECVASLNIPGYYHSEAQKMYKIADTAVTQSTEMSDVLKLFKKALKPSIEGNMSVDLSIFNFIQGHHNKKEFEIVSPAQTLEKKITDLHARYPLLPSSLGHYSHLEKFISNLTAYDYYIHAINSIGGMPVVSGTTPNTEDSEDAEDSFDDDSE